MASSGQMRPALFPLLRPWTALGTRASLPHRGQRTDAGLQRPAFDLQFCLYYVRVAAPAFCYCSTAGHSAQPEKKQAMAAGHTSDHGIRCVLRGEGSQSVTVSLQGFALLRGTQTAGWTRIRHSHGQTRRTAFLSHKRSTEAAQTRTGTRQPCHSDHSRPQFPHRRAGTWPLRAT